MADNTQNIQWFPGHMTKTKRQITDVLKLVDIVAEIIDARIPFSSRNPDLRVLTKQKPRIVLLNKCDIADKAATKQWIEYFKNTENSAALAINSKNGIGLNLFAPAVRNVLSEKLSRLKQKGVVSPTVRVLVAGIPNVGKSSFINKMSSKSKAKVEDRPGVTRGNQWFTVDKDMELLDTPGMLWHKFDDQKVGERLAFTGAVKDGVLDIELLAMRLLENLILINSFGFAERYKLEKDEILSLDSYDLLCKIAKNRGMLISRGEADTERAANVILDEFRGGKLGNITLELP
ncbi:MAG: ribosome biogenesis GTPase YlqF [Oscillospiraceae bacterium]|jgi:ribosome biogenesis GTPase A|nr:ribosome biogenesis GTPase YlqF [Oscillospiraceae bacterium]